MSEHGVPIEEATARDHIQVRAKLVKRLGGANNALVWARIFYRADEDSRAAELVDGEWWWQAAYGLIATETGLTEKQARAAVDALIEGSWIDRTPGKGRAFLYRPIVLKKAHLPAGADTASDLQGRSIGPEGQIHLPAGAVTPLIDLEDKTDTPIVPTDGIEELFEAAWKHWPRKDAKKVARQKFDRLKPTQHVHVALAIQQHGDAHAKFTPTQFVPHLATWLNQERWNDPLPVARGNGGVSPTDRALATLALAGVRQDGISA